MSNINRRLEKIEKTLKTGKHSSNPVPVIIIAGIDSDIKNEDSQEQGNTIIIGGGNHRKH